MGTFDRGFWENGRGHERRTELVTPLSVTRSTSTDRVDMVPRFSGLNPGNTARAPVCRADVPRVPEQFPEAVTHSTGLRSRLAADRASRREDARRCAVRRYPRCHKPRATAYRRPRVSHVHPATAEWRPRPLGTARGIFESPVAHKQGKTNPCFVGSQTPLPRRAVIRSTSNLRRHILDTRECGVQYFPRFFIHDDSKYS